MTSCRAGFRTLRNKRVKLSEPSLLGSDFNGELDGQKRRSGVCWGLDNSSVLGIG
jgi:hypothetical protein